MTPATDAVKQRIQSIDILRGAIMLIMALDHTRDFLHNAGVTADPTNMATTYPALFFTRWITHFCAPIFVFLSGVSVYLAGTRRTKAELAGFLIKRGIWLVLVEVILISFVFSLNPFFNVIAWQVIWVIGVSMILLGLLIWLPVRVIGLLGLLLILGHDYITTMKFAPGAEDTLMKILFTARGFVFPVDKTHFIFVLYAILPWTGVMFLGYLFGTLYNKDYKPESRRRFLLLCSFAVFALFLALRFANGYGDPAPWSVQKNGMFTFMSFLNVSKYPPSLMYCCLTLSVGMFVLAITEHAGNAFARFLKVYGSVPFFYYIPHFYIIRALSVITFFAQGYKTSQIVTPNAPFLFQAPGLGYSLGVVYLFWLLVILSLYYPCKWFSKYKKNHHQWWLSYL